MDNNCNCNENIRTHHVEKVMFYAHLSKLERWASLKIKIPFCSRYSSSWPCTPTCALEVVLPAPVFVLPRNGSHLSFPTFYLPICPLHPVEEGTVMSLNWTHFDERNFKIISWNFGHRVFCGVVSFKVVLICEVSHTYLVCRTSKNSSPLAKILWRNLTFYSFAAYANLAFVFLQIWQV